MLFVNWWWERNAKPFPYLHEIEKLLDDVHFKIRSYQDILGLSLLDVFIKLKLPYIFRFILYSTQLYLGKFSPSYSFLFILNLEQ